MDQFISQATRKVTDSEKEFWSERDEGAIITPPIPCRDCGLVWEHDPNCASIWRVGDISVLTHGYTRHGKVWCNGCKEWVDEKLSHAQIALREAKEGA
jgi:hypothetical protein